MVIDKQSVPVEHQSKMYQNAVHYRASQKPLGTSLAGAGYNADNMTCPLVSAGHPQHEYTTGTAHSAILAQFNLLDN